MIGRRLIFATYSLLAVGLPVAAGLSRPTAASAAPSATYMGGWTEDAQGCSHPLAEGRLQPGEYVFGKDARHHFEGRCRITHAEQSGSFGWKLDEVCGSGPSTRKARWTLSVAGDTMIASITRGPAKAGEPFTLKQCATK
ncbi:hypothetical protein [Methylobacterium radiotolerans]